MDLYQWLCLFGVPAIILGIYRGFAKRLNETRADTVALKLGVQALLRSQMIADYNKYIAQGYAPIYAKENFENCWKQYHTMGKNGVMDTLHAEFMELPTSAPEK